MPIGETFALAAALCWAIGSVLFSRIGKTVSPAAMNLMKCLTAATLLTLARIALAASTTPLHLTARSSLLLATSAVIGLTIGDTAYFAAMVRIGAPRAVLLLSAAPVFATVGGALLGETLSLRTALAIALTLAGIALAVTSRDDERDAHPLADDTVDRRTQRSGVAFGLLAALCQAAGSLLSRRAMADGIDPLAAAAGRVGIGAAALLVSAVIFGRAREWTRELAADFAWAKVALASIVGTFAGIWMAQIALARSASTGVATTLLATSPIFALPLAHFIGHERTRARAVIGAVVAVSGVALMTVPR
ncbi:MAG: DMT family transporter [Polyangiales bacterium]